MLESVQQKGHNAMWKKETLFYSVVLAMVLLQATGQIIQSNHAIAKVSLATNVGAVTAYVMPEKKIIYHRGMTNVLVSRDGNELRVTEAIPASRGILVSKRAPTSAEAALWYSYFSS
jgi:hypothetical protein